MLKRIILQNQLVSLAITFLILSSLFLCVSGYLHYVAVNIAAVICVYLAMRRLGLMEDSELIPHQTFFLYGVIIALGIWLVHVYVAAFHLSGTLAKYGVIAFLFVMSEVWWGPWLEKHTFVRWLLVTGVAVYMGFFLLHDKLGAKWFWATDHRISVLVGPDGLKLSQLPDVIINSEIAKPFSWMRYKPVHELYRILAAFFFQDSYFLWHLSKFIIFILVVLLTCLTFVRFLGFGAGTAIGLYLFTFDFWSDIYVKLNPSEALAALGVGMFVYFGLRCIDLGENELKTKTRTVKLIWYFWLSGLGAIISIGSKENFIIIFPFFLLLVGYLVFRRRLTIGIGLGILAVTLFAGLETMAIIHLAGKGHDIYMRPTDTGTRLQIALNQLSVIWPQTIESGVVVGIPILLAGLILFTDRDTLKQTLPDIAMGLFGIICCAGVYLFNFMFYFGKLPTHDRYDYPASLMLPVIFTLAFIVLLKVLKKVGMDLRVIHYGKSVLAAVLVVAMLGQGFGWRQKVLDYKNATLYFTNFLEKTSQDINLFDPGIPLVIEPRVLLYEEVFALRSFLRMYGVNNPVILKYTPGAPPTPYLKQNKKLYLELDRQFRKATTQGEWGYLPYSELEKYDKAVCIVLGADQGTCEKCIYSTPIFNWKN